MSTGRVDARAAPVVPFGRSHSGPREQNRRCPRASNERKEPVAIEYLDSRFSREAAAVDSSEPRDMRDAEAARFLELSREVGQPAPTIECDSQSAVPRYRRPAQNPDSLRMARSNKVGEVHEMEEDLLEPCCGPAVNESQPTLAWSCPVIYEGRSAVKAKRGSVAMGTGGRVHQGEGRSSQSSIRVVRPWCHAAQAAQSNGRPSRGGHDGTRARLDHVVDLHHAAGKARHPGSSRRA
jgi:hypothetical protein